MQIQILEAVARGIGHGFDIMDETGLPSGTVYPALSRLERDGLVHSRWENARIAHQEKRPPRRYYELTSEGRERLAEALLHYKELARSLAKIAREVVPLVRLRAKRRRDRAGARRAWAGRAFSSI